jgi:hypothetical protein
MTFPIPRLLCFALLLALGQSLAQPSAAQVVQLLSPAAGASLTHMPLSVALDFDSAANPSSLLVTLNGSDITSRFAIGSPVGSRTPASAEFVWGAAFVLAGTNLLEAEVELGGVPHSSQVSFGMVGDPYPDAVTSSVIGTNGGFNQAALPAVVLGPPAGSGLFGGSLDAFSLGLEGEIVLVFTDNVIVDGPGDDLSVFENPFFTTGLFEIIDDLFSEAATVSVSQDGSNWSSFACANEVGDHPFYPGCAGVYPALANGETDDRHPSVPTEIPPIESFIGQAKPNVVVPDGSGGDSFDLADVGLAWARYVRIEAADHVVGPFGPDNAGFDLDAVAAINSAPGPPPSVPALPGLQRGVLALLLIGIAAFAGLPGQRGRAPAAPRFPARARTAARPWRSRTGY